MLALGEGIFSCASFGVDEFAHGVSAKEIDVGELLCSLCNCDVATEFVHCDHCDDLVKRSFCVKLDLTVLVSNTEGFDRGLTYVDQFAVKIHCLAKAFAPKLAIPVCYVAEAVCIRHHN